MPPVFLHIGLSKTGTTACQHVCDMQRDELRTAGILYPLAGIDYRHHFHLAQAFLSERDVPPADRQAALQAYQTESAAAGLPVLISSEHFSDALEPDIEAILRFFGADTTIIVSLRNQIDWSTAMYAEAIRWGFRMSYERYLERSVSSLDFNHVLTRWEGVFGRARIRVIPYDTHRHDLVRQVLSTAGVPESVPAAAPDGERVYPTMSAPFVHLQCEASDGLAPGHSIEFGLARIEEEFRRRGVRLPRAWQIPDAFVQPMLDLDAVNDRIAERYGLPTPLFGQSMADLLAENQREAYRPTSVADWLLAVAAGTRA